MPTRSRSRDRGAHQADRLIRQLAEELRTARLAAGVSQATVARTAGVSASQIRRIEHARVQGVPLRTLSVVFAVLGMRLSARPYPEGPPIRDAAHARLLTRFRTRLSPTIRLRTEVPLRRGGGGREWARDLRAWDGELLEGQNSCKLEAETILHDLQATDRRIALKMEDDRVDRVILLVAATKRNRHVLREFRELIDARYPLDTRGVMSGLRDGRLPERSGVVAL